jgi:plasmid stabilization system protein ParE
MPVRRLHVTPSAERDLLEIWDFIAADSAKAADSVIAEIRSNFVKLIEFPGIGHRRDELGSAYRVWRVYSYLIVYRPDSSPLQIIRVVSGYRDLKRISM